LLTLGLTVVGIAWQFKNIAAWVGMHPLLGAISGTSVKEDLNQESADETHYWNIIVGRRSLCLLHGRALASGRTGRSQYLQSRSGDPVFFNRQ
jgi:hypothetical protein